jgi:hypothetical protein
MSAHMAAIRTLLGRLERLTVPEHLAGVAALISEIDQFEVQISLVGQVKAGKTMLTSSLIGLPGMLPSDVNPWTSVVTSIHINTQKPRNKNAVFTFYTEDEWANLTENGGHLGELAQRANFETELVDMRAQIAEMQRRTEDRLGANFSLLLGGQHSFLGFNPSIIERYVCLGEKDAPQLGTGRYADVTKAADFYLDDSSFGFPVTISDTPGVNDPFLARERATLDILSYSDICVVVLTAHQSFSTVDLALLRILLAMRSDQIILFVNRIDELEDPDRQIIEIDSFIRGILKDKGISPTVPIVFGSAAWAEHMQLGLASTPAASTLASLASLAADRTERSSALLSTGTLVLGRSPYNISKAADLSGLHELKSLIAHKSIRNVAAPFAAEILLRANDLAQQSSLLMEKVLVGKLPLRADLSIETVVDHLDSLLHDLDEDFYAAAEVISDRMLLTMSNAFREFIDSECDKIRTIIKSGRRIGDWAPESENLRRALNAAYHVFISDGSECVAAIYDHAARQITKIYGEVLDSSAQLFSVRAPRVFEPKTPASLMRSMTIDLKTTWINSWLARAIGPSTYVKQFQDAVTAEMRDFLAEMRKVTVHEFVDLSRRILHDFLSEHMQTMQSLAVIDGNTRDSLARQKLGVEVEVTQRMVALKGLSSELQALADAICADFDLVVT